VSRTQFEHEIEGRLRRVAEHVQPPGPLPIAGVTPTRTAGRHKPAILLGAAAAVVLLIIGATVLTQGADPDRIVTAEPSTSETAAIPSGAEPEPAATSVPGSATSAAPTSPTSAADRGDNGVTTPSPAESGNNVTTTPDPSATSSPPTSTTDPGDPVATAPNPRRTVFAEATSAVMIIDDGIDGIVIVDLDRSVATRMAIGGRSGDQPHRLWLTGGALVSGWDRISVTPLADLNTRDLAEATIFVPSTRDGEVWLIDYPGNRIGAGTPTYRLVTIDGVVLTEAEGLDPQVGFPQTGYGDGLVMASDEGILLWSPDGSTRLLPDTAGSVFISDVSERQIAWCNGQCTELNVTDTESLKQFVVSPPPGAAGFAARVARFSPDGKTLAAVTLRSTDSEPEAVDLMLIDTTTGEASQQTGLEVRVLPSISWSADSRELFFGARADSGVSLMGRYSLEGELEVVEVPFGTSGTAVIVDAAEIGPFDTELGPQSECLAVAGFPSGRTEACSFSF